MHDLRTQYIKLWIASSVILILIFVGLPMLTFVLPIGNPLMGIFGLIDKNDEGESVPVDSGNDANSQLTGNWETDCLTPDADSDWAEKHIFTISSDGTAIHHRWSGGSCATLKDDGANNYKLTYPASGQINFTDNGNGSTFYDIYQISGSALYFGHGFCNCAKDLASGTFGATPSTRSSSAGSTTWHTRRRRRSSKNRASPTTRFLFMATPAWGKRT